MTITTMAFRAPKHRALILALVVISFLTLLFMLCETQSGLGKAEEEVAKCQQKHDSVSAQLIVLYEHKTRLEKNLQAEVDRKKAVDEELKTLQLALSKDVVTQKEKVAKLLRQYEELKEQQKDEFNKLKATYESLRSEKEKLDGEVEDLNLQNQKLKESTQKLEEEIRKMEQMAPVDINEVAKLRERVKLCHVADVPEPAESKAPTGDGSNRVAGANVEDGKVEKPETVTETKTTTVKDETADHEVKQDAMGVLPAPQQPVKNPSSTNKPAVEAPKEVGPQPIPDDLNARPPAEQDDQRPSFFGHQFGDNVDRNQQPIFRHDKPPPVQEGQEDRDYPDNPEALKDDDGGADEGEDAVDKKDKKPGLQEDFDDANNNNNLNNNINNDILNNNNLNNNLNNNNNDGERLKLLPK